MTPDRWQQVARLFESALELPPTRRAAFLTTACRDDVALRGEVESLLQQEPSHAVADDLPGQVAADMLSGRRILTPGACLDVYQIVGPLGASGMGEVYQAYDTKLHRDVALKILHEEFVDDRDRLVRFTRESQVLASLNHQNIAAIYGSVETRPSGAATSRLEALVLELVAGPTLADRIADGPLATDEALVIARQVAEALRAAHDCGVIHGDLKPANIKVRDDGAVKVLDFGLAAPVAERPASVRADSSERSSSSSAVPGRAMADPDRIFGTPAYMSPEQAQGRIADKGSDVWAFGCVLYEMLTGRRAFGGGDVSSTLAAVLDDEPLWQALPQNLPAPIHMLLRRCLERDRKRRITDASTIQFLLDEAAAPAASAVVAPGRGGTRKSMAWFVVTAACGAALSSAAWWIARPPMMPGPLWTLSLSDRVSSAVSNLQGSDVPLMASFSPDGRWIAYQFGSVGPDTFPSVFIRPFPATGAKYRIAEGIHPLWSPDGKELLYKLGPSRPLTAVSVTTAPAFSIGEPRPVPVAIPTLERDLWFDRDSDMAPDGALIVAAPLDSATWSDKPPTQIHVVLNWFGELKLRAVPESTPGKRRSVDPSNPADLLYVSRLLAKRLIVHVGGFGAPRVSAQALAQVTDRGLGYGWMPLHRTCRSLRPDRDRSR
jgi:serine/threonine protein kinase